MNRNYSQRGSGLLAGRHSGGIVLGGSRLNVYFQWMADNKDRLMGMTAAQKGALYRQDHGRRGGRGRSMKTSSRSSSMRRHRSVSRPRMTSSRSSSTHSRHVSIAPSGGRAPSHKSRHISALHLPHSRKRSLKHGGGMSRKHSSKRGGYGNSSSVANNPWIKYFKRVMAGEITMADAKAQYKENRDKWFKEDGLTDEQIALYDQEQRETLDAAKARAHARRNAREIVRGRRLVRKGAREAARQVEDNLITIASGPQVEMRRLKPGVVRPRESYRSQYHRTLLRNQDGSLKRVPNFDSMGGPRPKTFYQTRNEDRIRRFDKLLHLQPPPEGEDFGPIRRGRRRSRRAVAA